MIYVVLLVIGNVIEECEVFLQRQNARTFYQNLACQHFDLEIDVNDSWEHFEEATDAACNESEDINLSLRSFALDDV